MDIRQGYENCREAIGWGHGNHGPLPLGIRSADLYPDRRGRRADQTDVVRGPAAGGVFRCLDRTARGVTRPYICTGENLARRQGFKDFIIHQGCDILHPDLRNSGGFLETKRIADMAAVYGLPMSTHNTGSQLHTWATCQWAASIRDFLAVETITGQGGWMDQLLLLDGPYIKERGFVQVTDKPGLGVEINPDVAKAHLAPGEAWWG